MQKKLSALLSISLFATPVLATSINFVGPLAGVDSPTGWSTDSTDDNVINLGQQSYSLLSGAATVAGFQNGSPTDVSLSQTGARGLGVWDDPASPIPVEGDEIDNFGGPETISIDFHNVAYDINSVQVSSLFNSTASRPNTNYLGAPTPPEQAFVDFYLNGTLISTQTMTGTDFLGSGNGDQSLSFTTPIIADLVVFRVPTSADLGLTVPPGDNDPYIFTDYAVAGLNVTAIPTAVPLPASAFAALPLLLVLAAGKILHRRRA